MQYIHSNVPTLKRGDVVDPLFSVAYKFGYTERKKSGGVSRKSIDIMVFFFLRDYTTKVNITI